MTTKTASKKRAATASRTAATTTVSKTTATTKHKKGQRYANVKFDEKKIMALFKEGKNLTDIAEAIGFPRGVGQNRTAAVLIKAGVYKRGAKRSH